MEAKIEKILTQIGHLSLNRFCFIVCILPVFVTQALRLRQVAKSNKMQTRK